LEQLGLIGTQGSYERADVGTTQDEELLTLLRKEVMDSCLGSSSGVSSLHGCNQQQQKFSSNYGKWRNDDFYSGANGDELCSQYHELMAINGVHDALSALGFDANFIPNACR
jgi:hypothetical protein